MNTSFFRTWKLILILPVLILSSCRRPHPQNCADFKTGKFEYYYILDNHRNRVSMTRVDSVQTEVDPAMNRTAQLRIVWKGDCEYTIYPLLNDGKPHNSRDSFFSKKGMDVTIVETTHSHYIYIARVDSAGKKWTMTDTVWRFGK